MQFQIEKLILWPKNQKYSYKDINLNINSVNVITGDSRTGKSAIIPIIDYCLASGECYIPTQTIRNACSWFGVVVKLEKSKVLLARKEPGTQKSTSDMMFILGEEIEIPDMPEKNSNCQAVKRFLDEYARLSFLETEDSYYGRRPAFRDLMSFCFQPQNVVANANILFYKTDKTEHRNKLINIFPYVLGAITPEVLSARQELMDLQRKLKKKESDYEKLCELTIRWENEIKAWISVAIELGLLEENSRNMKFETQLVLLQEIVKDNTEDKIIKGNGIIKSSEEIVMLRETENELAMELTKYKNRHIEMSQLMKSVSDYRDALSIQVERLNITEWLDEKAKKENICPVCQQKCSDASQRNIYLSRLEDNRKKKKHVEEIPAAFEREYDMVKGQIQRLTDELVAVQKRIRIEENKFKQLRENEEANPSRYTLDGISRFLGKIEYARLRQLRVFRILSKARQIPSGTCARLPANSMARSTAIRCRRGFAKIGSQPTLWSGVKAGRNGNQRAMFLSLWLLRKIFLDSDLQKTKPETKLEGIGRNSGWKIRKSWRDAPI